MSRSALALTTLLALGACESDQEIVGPDLEDGYFHDFLHPGDPISDVSLGLSLDERFPKIDGEKAFDRFRLNLGEGADYTDLVNYINRYIYMVTGHYGDRLGEEVKADRPNYVEDEGEYTGALEWHYEFDRSSDEVWMAFLEREFDGDEALGRYSLVPLLIDGQYYKGGRYSIFVNAEEELDIDGEFVDALDSLSPERE